MSKKVEFKMGDRISVNYRGETITGWYVSEGIIERNDNGGWCRGSDDIPKEYSDHGHSFWHISGSEITKLEDSAIDWIAKSLNSSTEAMCGIVERDKEQIKEIINNKEETSMLQKLTTTLKKHLPGPIQKQYRAGFRNGDMELTSNGVGVLLEIVADKYEKELTESAVAQIAEVESEQKG